MHYTFYILYSETKKRYYIGYTGDDLQERIRKHNFNHKGFTGNVGDWVLKYAEKYQSKETAYKREREVKSWKSRRAIEKLMAE